MNVKIQDIESEGRRKYLIRAGEFSMRRPGAPPNMGMLHHEMAVWRIRELVKAGMESLQKVKSAFPLAYSEGLASELKSLVEPYVSESRCSQLLDTYGVTEANQRAHNYEILLLIRNNALNGAYAEIDLWTDEIRNKEEAAQTGQKEMESKFGILFSINQASRDFEEWTKGLNPKKNSIAFIFLDIDNFKDLNTTYTETVVDETILPESMHLIRGLAHLRGGAYRHGGEEFLVILPNQDESDATSFAEKLRREFESTDFAVREEVKHLTVSIGVALWPQHGSTYDEVLEEANKAEREAKVYKNTWVLARS